MKGLTNAAQMLNADGAITFPLQAQPPRQEVEIMKNWGGACKPVVSICCATFNHVNYIEDAIRGFLAQETTFAFEIIIRDDASTDGTTDIVRDYAQRYPNIIRAVIHKENQYSKGIKWLHEWPDLIMGENYAPCEGDDFWISPVKLQMQFELLEKYPQAVMSVAMSHNYRQDGDKLHYLETTKDQDKILLGVNEIHKTYFHTSTYLIRANLFKEVIRKYFVGHTLYGDTALRAILIMSGPFAFLSRSVSVYRITETGVWGGLNQERRLKWEFDVARKLSAVLPGCHGACQRQRAYFIAMKLFQLYVKDVQIIEGVKIAPLLFWYKLIRVPGYIRRKLKAVSQA